MERKIFSVIAVILFLMSAQVMNGQIQNMNKQQQGVSRDRQTGMGMSSGMQGCMDQIAADSTMRGQMISRMMDSMKGDSAGMKQLCKKLMENPDMRKTMMNMMDHSGMGGRMQGMEGRDKDIDRKNGNGVHGQGRDIVDTVKVLP